jgi:PIN domain nuclease of toxin-antitoxin system
VKLLLDTHIWLWSLLTPERLGRETARALEADDTELWLSPISVWEALMLMERGRVEVDVAPADWVAEALVAVPMTEAPLTHAVALESRRLRLRHTDPADRFLAATALVYGLTLVTADRRLTRVRDVAVLPNR